MTLAEFVKKYRAEHDLSQRQFAKKCGVSNGYISIIENEMHYKTGRKMDISIGKMKLLADGMGMSLHDLLTSIDDMQVSLDYSDAISSADKTATPSFNEEMAELIHLFSRVPEERKGLVLEMIRAALKSLK